MLTEILKTRINIQYYVLSFVSLTHIRLSVNLVYRVCWMRSIIAVELFQITDYLHEQTVTKHVYLDNICNIFYIFRSSIAYSIIYQDRMISRVTMDWAIWDSIPGRAKFSLFWNVQTGYEATQLPVRWVPGLKRPRREADHAPSTSAQIKNEWSYISTTPRAFIAWPGASLFPVGVQNFSNEYCGKNKAPIPENISSFKICFLLRKSVEVWLVLTHENIVYVHENIQML